MVQEQERELVAEEPFYVYASVVQLALPGLKPPLFKLQTYTQQITQFRQCPCHRHDVLLIA